MPSVDRVFTIDQTLYRYFQDRKLSNSYKLRFLPDPAEFTGDHTKESARATLGIPADARVILLYGALDRRKGVRSILDKLQDLDTESNTHLLFVGKQTPAVAEMLSEPAIQKYFHNGRIHEVNRYVSPEEEQMAFAAADVAWLRYEGFYQMSGVLVKAVQANLELELPEDGLLGWYKNAPGDTRLTFHESTWAHAKRLLFESV